MPLSRLLSNAEAKTKSLGHDIVWATVGDRVAHGRCSRCGREVSVAVSSQDLHETNGSALHEPCRWEMAHSAR